MSERRVVDGQAEKFCPECEGWKPETADYFYRMRSGLRNLCKPCYVQTVLKRHPTRRQNIAQSAADLLDSITRRWVGMA
jgi:hypothetical protein